MFALPEEPASEGAPDWMVSYADMITILMSFFAVMFSMAMSKDGKKDAPMIKSLHRQFGAPPTTIYFPFGAVLTPNDAAKTTSQKDYRNRGPIADFAQVSTSPFDDQATIGGVIYFDPAQSGLDGEQRKQLQILAKVLAGKSSKIEILARTLGQPQDTDDQLDENWNLAHARCDRTMRYLATLGIDPARIRIGVAARFEPIHAGGDELLLETNDSVEVFTLSAIAEDARAEPTDHARD
jgi:chemotaxis protein MotB